MDVPYTLPPTMCKRYSAPDLVIIAIAAAANASRRRAHPGTSGRCVPCNPMGGHTRVVLRRDRIPLVAQAYFATTLDTLDAARMGNRCAIIAERLTHQKGENLGTRVSW